MKTDIVPFGKYKGQPVEVLAEDREYCDWLTGQEWFRLKFSGIHTLIINQFGPPTETPDHNALQALFTDPIFAARLVLATHGGWAQLLESRQSMLRDIEARMQRLNEQSPYDLLQRLQDAKSNVKRLSELIHEQREGSAKISIYSIAFEDSGADV